MGACAGFHEVGGLFRTGRSWPRQSIFAGSISCLNGYGDGLDRTQRACAERDTPVGQAGDFTAAVFSDAALSLTACATYAGTMDDRIGRDNLAAHDIKQDRLEWRNGRRRRLKISRSDPYGFESRLQHVKLVGCGGLLFFVL